MKFPSIAIGFNHKVGSSGPNGAPHDLSVVVLNDTSLRVTHQNGATSFDGTKYYYSLDGVTNWMLGATIVGSGLTQDITGLTQNTTYYVRAAHYKGSKLSDYSSIVSDWTLPDFVFSPVAEDRARIANRIYTYSGTIRYVNSSAADDTGNGLTAETAKKYITSAYSLSSAGDRIYLADGTYPLASEPNAYLFLGASGRNVLLQGNTANRLAVILEQTAGSFCIRKYQQAGLVLSYLTIQSALNLKLVYESNQGDNSETIFDNCYFRNTSTDAAAACYNYSDINPSYNRWIEFKNCILENSSSTLAPISFTSSQEGNTQYLITNSFITSLGGGRTFGNPYACKTAIYDTVLEQQKNSYIGFWGQDTAAPTVNVGDIDVRGCTFVYTHSSYGHGVLLGRGVVKYYFVNNKIENPNTNDGANIGLVIKGICASLSDGVCHGNKVTAPRPYLVKGGQNNDAEHNIFISNQAVYYGPALNSVSESGVELLAKFNTIKNNVCYAPSQALYLIPYGADSLSIKECVLTGEINNNTYCTNSGYYLNDTVNTIQWADLATYWDFDSVSKFKTGVASPV